MEKDLVEYIAKFLSASHTIYRVHGFPDEEEMQKIYDIAHKYKIDYQQGSNINFTLQNVLNAVPSDKHRVFDKIFLRNMKKAEYSIVNIGHFGLAMQYYTHFTSPIRRLCDLIIHHQIKAKIGKSQVKFNKKTLETYAKIATRKEILADTAERDVEYRFEMQFMKNHLGEIFTGVIVNLSKTAIIVELDRYPITGKIKLDEIKSDYYSFINSSYKIVGKRSGRIFQLADELKVRIALISDEIILELI